MPSFLTTYFRSGWAFLIPYLAVYLLYAGLDWPVNVSGADVEGKRSLGNGSGLDHQPAFPPASSSFFHPPALLHVYWVLHAIHLLLAMVTLVLWRHAQTRKQTSNVPPASIFASFQSSSFAVLTKGVPWLLLALLFWIPGIYLEWPSDPWEHLRRINEWQAHETVTAHSAWNKSSYFLPYSLIQAGTRPTQLNWLNAFYTAVCLLLSWQYYRFARAVGLSVRASFVFVILNAISFGNNIFSFYRYYGISSSIFAQIGAVALVRIALEACGKPVLNFSPQRPNAARQLSRDAKTITAYRTPASSLQTAKSCAYRLLSTVVPIVSLVTFIVFNHLQGLAIAGIGIVAVITCHLIAWKRSMVWWLIGASAIVSLCVVIGLPKHPSVEDIYRNDGWLNTWYGFNLLSKGSPAFERAWHILGVTGLISVVAAVGLVAFKNSLVGWLTLMPVLVLLLPCFSLPLANWLASQASAGSIVVFHRMLFAIPTGLAMVAVIARWQDACKVTSLEVSARHIAPRDALLQNRSILTSSLVIGTLLLATLSPPGANAYNRTWHSFQVPPTDLTLRGLSSIATRDQFALLRDSEGVLLAPPQPAQVFNAFLSNQLGPSFRSPNRFSYVSPNEVIQWTEASCRLLSTTSSTNFPPSVFPLTPGWRRVEITPDTMDKGQETIDLTAPQMRWLDKATPLAIPISVAESSMLEVESVKPIHLFHATAIPLKQGKRYRLSCLIRQSEGGPTINYLAIAWRKKDGEILSSNQPAPHGAGFPDGWQNGTYSYYGLVGQPALPAWTHYTVSFGRGEAAAIPGNAAYIQAGALLNFAGTGFARFELKEVLFEELPAYTSIRLILPAPLDLYTPTSLAARLSGHWRPQQIHDENAGANELFFAVSRRAPAVTATHQRVSTSTAPGGG